jgi:excinuclease ABC subunit C
VDINQLDTKNLPLEPGVYIFKGENDESLYIGKAKNLRNRVKSYFSKSKDKRLNVSFLMLEAADLDFITTQNEEEALLLENKLIKLRQPKYNVLLKDDKNYSSIRVELNEEYPRISIVRKCSDKDSIYLGPFKSSESVRKTKRFFQKTFGLRDCSNNKFNMHKSRACLYKDIGMCLGPCDDNGIKSEYDINVEKINSIFKGKIGELKKNIEKKMNELAEKEMFEQASFLRDELEIFNNNNYFDAVSAENLKNTDIIGIHSVGNSIQIAILFFRGGFIIDKADLFFHSKTKNIKLESYEIIKQFYSMRSSVPKKIFLPSNFDFQKELLSDLTNLGIKELKIDVIQKGKKLKLVELAEKNAKMQFEVNFDEDQQLGKNLKNLKEALGLKQLPQRIECFDISNTQGTNAVASMVTFKNCKPDKASYRKFNIKTNGPDDYGMMKEAINRRINRIGQNGWERPDLILLDGGKGHLNKIKKLIPENIGLASIAKPRKSEKIDKIYLPNIKSAINFDGLNDELNILINLRNEAHRFAINFHKSKRGKEMINSSIFTSLKINKQTINKLIRKFRDINGIASATDSELKELGINKNIIQKILLNLRRNQ